MAGIYIHIPFCKQACSYCNFYFTTSPKLKSDFTDAILQEIALQKHFFNGEKVETIYFGGGTPTRLATNDLIRISEAIFKSFSCNISEFTIEANPDDLTQKKLRELSTLKHFGLNRFSIGVQSFFEDDLRYMNRAHSAQEALNSIKRTQDFGFELLTIDLIYGTPTLQDSQWIKNLEIMNSLQVPHFSSYALTVEEGTNLSQKIKKKKSLPVDEEKASIQFDMLMKFAAGKNFEHYEISNFAKQGKRAIHNSNYWLGKSYLGLGPAAHSFKNLERSWNKPNLRAYISNLKNGLLNNEYEKLSQVQHANEYIMTALRTATGLNLNHILICDFKQTLIEKLQTVNPEFYFLNNDIVILKNKGKHFADAIALAIWLE